MKGKPFALTCLLVLVIFSAGYGQSDKTEPPKSGAPYVSDAVPTVELVNRNYVMIGPDCKNIQILGIHKISEAEYKIITNSGSSGKGMASDVLYDLWKLESKEWVMTRPNLPVVMHVKLLNP